MGGKNYDSIHERPPAVVVCPQCDGGIYQHRHGYEIDCNDCDYIDTDPNVMDYEIVRFDCPDCGADIESGFNTEVLSNDPLIEEIAGLRCKKCGMEWERPHY